MEFAPITFSHELQEWAKLLGNAAFFSVVGVEGKFVAGAVHGFSLQKRA
jgi:hypothetical protein